MFWEVGGFDSKNKEERWDKVLIFPQELNSYSYVVNNPLNYTDPTWENTMYLYGDVWTWTPADFIVKAYVTWVVTIGAYLWKQFSDHVVDNIVESISSNSATGSPSPGKPPKKDDKSSKNTVDTNAWKLNISQHAAERMAQRSISKSMIQNTVNKGTSFNYIHNWKQLQWFYDKTTQIFVGKHWSRITTVINKVKQNYINNLKSTWK